MKKLFQSQKTKFFIMLLITISIFTSIYFKYIDNHPSRYCDEKKRVLTNEEFIIAALEHEYESNAIKIDDSTKTAKDFYRKYLNCCMVGKRPTMIKRNFWGDLYDENQGHVMMTLFYPTSPEDLARPIRVYDGTESQGHLKYIDKTLAYTKASFQMSDCGDVGKSTHENLNIQDTPFANNLNN